MGSPEDRKGNRHRQVRQFRAALALGATSALLAVGLLSGCQGDRAEEPGDPSLLADQEIDGFTLTQTREGERLWVLSAVRGLVYEETDRVELETVRVDYFDDDGSVRSTLSANRGVLKRRTSDMEAHGNVIVVAKDGTRLVTERLTWNERTGKIESDRFVRVTQGDDVFTGVGLEADPDLKNIKVKSEFRAYVRTPDGELVEEE